MSLYTQLQHRAATRNPIRVGLIGAGKFGSMYLAQVVRTPGVHLVAIADLNPAGAKKNLARVGWTAQQSAATSAASALRDGNTWITDDWQALVKLSEIDIVVECTGSPVHAVDHVLAAIGSTSMSSTSPSRPTPSAARCWRAARPKPA